MQVRNTPDRWGAVQQGLHWLIAALALAQIYVGYELGGLPRDATATSAAFSLHATLGLTILALMLFRLYWRRRNPVPLMPERLGAAERALARLTHHGFYTLLIALPVTGYLMACARGYAVPFYGLSLPRLVGPDETLAAALFYGHIAAVYLTLIALALHVAGALRHEFLLRDNTLRRMTSLPPRGHGYAARTTEPERLGVAAAGRSEARGGGAWGAAAKKRGPLAGP